MRGFAAELAAAGDEPVLVRGEGAAFSAGLDLDALDRGALHELLAVMDEAAGALFLHPGPTVACINGHAVAGGCLLALCCDHRVAQDDPGLRVGMTGLALGLLYPPIVLEILRYRLPSHTLDRVLLGAERFSAREALELGLVDEVAPNPLESARARLGRLASYPRGSYAQTKRLLREGALRLDRAERERRLEETARAWDPDSIRARLRRGL
jgi:enoyl-CoA hydratase/carnithine racemase